MSRLIQEAIFRYRAARWLIALAILGRGRLRLIRGRLYRGLDDICWVKRVSNVPALERIAERIIFRAIADIRNTGRNAIAESYRADAASSACASLFTLTGRGPHDLFRDLIVLRRATADSKGVILLKYVRTFDAVVALFDLAKLMDRYVFVLEPCWAGYCDPSLLMFIAPGQPVLVQCFTDEDFDFVTQIGAPLVPVRLGPADWVDADMFEPRAGQGKPYDLVMVANWAPHKRHRVLFRALQRSARTIRVLLIGFPWAGRTAADVRREAAQFANRNVELQIVESLPATEVASHVSRCKAFVFLSRKEGDNKALVEAMFADVPAIVYDKTIGGARSRINPSTGVLASDEELPAAIERMLDHHHEFSPRAWALRHTGSANATRVVDEILRTIPGAGAQPGDGIVEKTNSPNLAYKDPTVRTRFRADYDFILSCCRYEVASTAQVHPGVDVQPHGAAAP